jgi:hypothetical protein
VQKVPRPKPPPQLETDELKLIGGLETDLGPVAERLRRRGAVAAKRDPLFRRLAIPVVVF